MQRPPILDHQGAGAIGGQDGLGQHVGGRVSQTLGALTIGQLDDLVSLEVAGQRGVANLLNPAGILHPVAGIHGSSVTNLGVAHKQGLVAEQTDRQLSADIAPSGNSVSAFHQFASIVSVASGHTITDNNLLANHDRNPPYIIPKHS